MSSVVMRDGTPFYQHLYPAYQWRGNRKRQYGVLYQGHASGELYATDETGQVTDLSGDARCLYDRLKAYVQSEGRTLYTTERIFGRRQESIIVGASVDKGAQLVYSPRTGVRGVRFAHSGKHKRGGAILSASVWGQPVQNTHDWLTAIRHVSSAIGAGDYDSAGALGSASLNKFWTEQGMSRMWRLPEHLSTLTLKYGIGGRAETYARPEDTFPVAWEVDLDSAYPTAVARGLPTGELVYQSNPGRPADWQGLFGVFSIHIDGDIELSPIPVRDWSIPGSALRWKLYEGDAFEYAGWHQEIQTLLDTGRASVIPRYCWTWTKCSSFLAPWVDDLGHRRDMARRDGRTLEASLYKQIANAAIGRWGMGNEQWMLVTTEEHDIELGDMPVCDEVLCGLWVRKTEELGKATLPYHWSSYVKMAVRLELYRRAREELRAGGDIIFTNFDSIMLKLKPRDSTIDKYQRPWSWKSREVRDVSVPYIRGSLMRSGGEPKIALPGLSGRSRSEVVGKWEGRE